VSDGKNGDELHLPAATIRSSFYVPVRMKVFAWNDAPRKRYGDDAAGLDKNIYRQMLQTGFLVLDPFTGAVKGLGRRHRFQEL